ncbi:MAG TPA: heavy metal-associated domain-containing protein [Oceanobacillus sp.]|nr:heavy metal-associated domain-containing protein [Oceanobacillus sp.]
MQSTTFQLPSVAAETDWVVVENALRQINGMRHVEVHRLTRLVTVQYSDPASWDDISRTLDGLGYVPDNAEPW